MTGREPPVVEALFKTAKYRPEFPAHRFAGLDEARTWAKAFVGWYNDEHRHGGIRYVTPAQRHAGRDREILAARYRLYRRAKERNPSRWSGRMRDWSPIDAVTLNPERDAAITAASHAEQKNRRGCMTQATTPLTRSAVRKKALGERVHMFDLCGTTLPRDFASA